MGDDPGARDTASVGDASSRVDVNGEVLGDVMMVPYPWVTGAG